MFLQISSKPTNILLPISPGVILCGSLGSKHQQTNFVTKLGIVMHHDEPECHAQGQGHSKGSYDQNMMISTIFFELLILLLPIWFDSTLSRATVSYDEIGLLSSWSQACLPQAMGVEN